MVVPCDPQDEPDQFNLISEAGPVYKFSVTTPTADVWVKKIRSAIGT